MPREFLKRYAPDPARFSRRSGLGRFGKSLRNPNLWYLNRRSVSHAVAYGLFCAFMPIPLQMVLAAAGAIAMRINVWISVAMVWITNPITIPPLFYFSYRVGAWLMHEEPLHVDWSAPWGQIIGEAMGVWQPLLLGSLVCGIAAAFLGYTISRVLWRLHLVSRWRARRERVWHKKSH